MSDRCAPACNCPPGAHSFADLDEDPPDRTSPPSAHIVGRFTGPNGEACIAYELPAGEQSWGVR